MAQKPLTNSATDKLNFVAQDEIWKYRLQAESDARHNWSTNWGFLTISMEELLRREGEVPKPPKPKIELPGHLRIRPVTPVEKYIKVYPSPPVPQTTQGFIGWRSTIPGLELEKNYRIISCKGAYAKQLQWPEPGIY
ncbi:uncharacterized protein C20orf85 homolog [Dromiciops gliroides]|uniref:uncharacterized protein C20orf85 homolog n=1 Tax=Dromiciops gliroides TaxID=33562 RepID=UPI001CC6B17D|nr:uncharacterized protein C20orf85 homolog [Dromiciops gliroides]